MPWASVLGEIPISAHDNLCGMLQRDGGLNFNENVCVTQLRNHRLLLLSASFLKEDGMMEKGELGALAQLGQLTSAL